MCWSICNFSFKKGSQNSRSRIAIMKGWSRLLYLRTLKMNDCTGCSLFRKAHPAFVALFPLMPTLASTPIAQPTTSIYIIPAFLLYYFCTFLIAPAGAACLSYPIHCPSYQLFAFVSTLVTNCKSYPTLFFPWALFF